VHDFKHFDRSFAQTNRLRRRGAHDDGNGVPWRLEREGQARARLDAPPPEPAARLRRLRRTRHAGISISDACDRLSYRVDTAMTPGEDVAARTEAAVLVPLYRDDREELRVVLVARSSIGIHGGQVGLPGGRREPGDSSLLETALRETEEEIGLGRSEIDVLAALDPVDTRTTGFRVHPFVARVRVPGRWSLATGEIAAVLTPSVRSLADPRLRSEAVLSFPGWPEPRRVDHIALDDGHAVWGLTLRLLDSLLPRLLAGEWTI
jgi:8-oxo-dGTP pyrophosphatase MutT (NUDIX family)